MQADDSQAERGSPKRQRLSTPSEQDECASEVIAGPSSTPQDAAMDDKENADPAAVVEAGAATEDGVDQTNANGHKKVDKGKGREDDFVPVHGNYRGYYGKRRLGQDPYQGDERLKLIPKEWMQDQAVLDIGCNAGGVTIEIAQQFRPSRITGVDIDGELIRTAHKRVRIAWSTQEPLPSIGKAAEKERQRSSRQQRRYPSRSPEPLDASEASAPSPHHFPAALSRMYGYLPQPPDKYLRQYIRPTEDESRERSQRRDGKRSRGNVMPKRVTLFPNNISFKKADWVNEELSTDKRGYDCILALSVVKWIHLNNGDEGLVEFFTRVFMSLHPNGRFILEPQPWESYQKAARLSDSLKESYSTIKIRPEDFERILLQDIGFTSVEKLSDDSGKGFKRPLHVYRRAAGSWL